MTMSLSAPSKWLADALTSLLSTPHTNTAAMNMDLAGLDASSDPFDTRFNDVFMRHARGLVGGREVDREELKNTLRALQAKWDASACRYEDCAALHRRIDGFHPEMGVRIEFTPSASSTQLTITCEACVAKQRGRTPRIKTLMIDGDPSLFQAAS